MRTDVKNFPKGVDTNQLLYLIYQAISEKGAGGSSSPVHFDLGDQDADAIIVSRDDYDAIVAACTAGRPVTVSFHVSGELTICNAPVVYATDGAEDPIVMTPEKYYGDLAILVKPTPILEPTPEIAGE